MKSPDSSGSNTSPVDFTAASLEVEETKREIK
jgi:hypothetical protein